MPKQFEYIICRQYLLLYVAQNSLDQKVMWPPLKIKVQHDTRQRPCEPHIAHMFLFRLILRLIFVLLFKRVQY